MEMRAPILNTRRVRQIDCCPSDILRSIGVCTGRMATGHAAERVTGSAAAFIHAAAFRAGPGRAPRFHKAHRNPSPFGLVDHKALELPKRPRVQTTTLLFVSPYPFANPLEVFHRDAATGAFGNVYKLFGNTVVNIRGEAPLLQSPTAEKPFSARCALLLKLFAEPRVAGPTPVGFGSRELRAVRSGGDVDDAEVHADPIEHFGFAFFGNVDRGKQEPISVPVNQIGFAPLKGQHFALALSTNKGDREATINRPDAYAGLGHGPGEYPQVIGDRPMRAKATPALLVERVGVGHLGNQADHDLSRQREILPDLLVEQPLQRKPSKFARFKSQLAQRIASGIGRFQGAFKRVRLLGRGLQLNLDDQLDGPIKRQIFENVNGIPPYG
jgi:hypothetical protein